MKKTVINTFVTATALIIASAAHAQTPPTWPAAPEPSPGDIKKLEQYISVLYQNVGDFMINQNFQPISELQQMINTNTLMVNDLSPNQAAGQQAAKETSNNLTNSLQQFPYAIFQSVPNESKKFKTAEGQPYTDYMKDNEPKSLAGDPKLLFTQASDTPYATQTQVTGFQASPKELPWLKAPSTGNNSSTFNNGSMSNSPSNNPILLENNNNFNFASLITPTAYSSTEAAAAKRYVIYAAQSTQDLTTTLTNCKERPCSITELASNPAALIAIKKDPIYAEFALTVRSMLAIRSITINTLNHLIAERTPMPGLAAAAGFNKKDKSKLTPQEQNELKNNEASPLQVAEYQANHRIQDPNWYQSVQNASPADVQRNILIVLAEIEHQNYEAHLDRERLLAAITASNLQSSLGTANTVLEQEGAKLNTEITAVINNLKSPAVQGPTKTTTTPVSTKKPTIK